MKKLLAAAMTIAGLALAGTMPAHAGIVTGVVAFTDCTSSGCGASLIIAGGEDDTGTGEWHSAAEDGALTVLSVDSACDGNGALTGSIVMHFIDEGGSNATLTVDVLAADGGVWTSASNARAGSLSNGQPATGLQAAGAGTYECATDTISGLVVSPA